MMRGAVMVIAVAALAGCVRAPLELSPPPADLLEPCPAPLVLPLRDATQGEVVRWWGADRGALRACGDRHEALAGWARAVAR